jgi:1,4-alpha-glucan branching enzyme
MAGALSLVLEVHVPFVRHHGRDPIGEDALHLTIAETLVPLINLLYDLRASRVPIQLGLACSPVLMEQLADPVVQKHFLLWMQRWLNGVEANLARWNTSEQRHLRYLAQFYLEWGHTIVSSFQSRYRRNLIGALRELCDAGLVEPLLLPATNARLAFLSSESAVRGQIEAAMLNVLRHLGQLPKGLWLVGGYRGGLEQVLRRAGLSYLVLPGCDVEGGESGWLLSRRVAVLARDDALEHHSFSAELGYPGDPLFRALDGGIGEPEPPYRRFGSGDPGPVPAWYDPYYAFLRTREHAQHFLLAARAQFQQREGEGRPLALLCGYPSGFGRPRWFEGMAWLRNVFELAMHQPAVEMLAPHSLLQQRPPRKVARALLAAGGRGLADRRLEGAAQRMTMLVERLPDADTIQERLLNQAGRELLLAQDAAWEGVEPQRAQQGLLNPVENHLDRFDWLAERAELPVLDAAETAELEVLEDQDCVFPLLNYRVFAAEPR